MNSRVGVNEGARGVSDPPLGAARGTLHVLKKAGSLRAVPAARSGKVPEGGPAAGKNMLRDF